jgi:hypothetical protein
MMDATGTAKARLKQILPNSSWEHSMTTSTENIFELLEQNAKWWEQAAVLCEHTVAQLEPGRREEWQLMGAVYRERADKHVHLIEFLRQKGDLPSISATPPTRGHSEGL